jgi:tetratricopeptide (TPR) repeat protein
MILTKSVFAAVALSLGAGPPAGRAASADNLWRSLATKAQDLRIDGRFTESHQLARQALREAERFGPTDIRIAVTLNEIGLDYFYQGRYREAESAYLRGIRLAERDGGHRLELVALLANMALLRREDGSRYAEAERLLRRALELAESQLGPDHPGLLSPVTDLAAVCVDRRHYSQAQDLLGRAFLLVGKNPDPHIAAAESALNNLGGILFYKMQRYSEAISYLNRAIASHEQRLRPNHPNLIYPLLNLARVHLGLHAAHAAEPLVLRALAIAESEFGPDHPLTAEALSTYAKVLRKTGRKKEASAAEHRAAAIAALYPGRGGLANSIVDISDLRAHR